jgi:hypothetical protein
VKLLSTTVLSAILLMSAGCCSTTDLIRQEYTQADRATFDAVAPKYLEYVEGDASLDAEQKARRKQTINTWRLRLEQAETPAQPEGE